MVMLYLEQLSINRCHANWDISSHSENIHRTKDTEQNIPQKEKRNSTMKLQALYQRAQCAYKDPENREGNLHTFAAVISINRRNLTSKDVQNIQKGGKQQIKGHSPTSHAWRFLSATAGLQVVFLCFDDNILSQQSQCRAPHKSAKHTVPFCIASNDRHFLLGYEKAVTHQIQKTQ